MIACSALVLLVASPDKVAACFPGKGPVPKGARVSIQFDQDEYFLGENILLHFLVQNAGKVPFDLETGGDYRMASRDLRFQVEAVDEQGQSVPDPDPSGFSFGGLVGQNPVRPGDKWYASVPLTRYCRFDNPGTYIVCGQHDFGWKATIRNPLPYGEARIVLRMPTPDEAEHIVQVMESLPSDGTSFPGIKTEPYEDFTTLAYPVYLASLLPRAQREDERALKAIGRIPAVDATAALLKLIENGPPSCRLEAAQELSLRLPAPELDGQLPFRYINPQETLQCWLLETGWRDEFANRVRACAREFLSAPDEDSVTTGAFMMECVGTAEDAEPLIKALDNAIAATSAKPAMCLHPTGAPEALLRPAVMLARRGYEPQRNPATLGAIALYLATIAERPDFRPADWEMRYKDWLHHPIAYLRQITLDHIPSPVTEPILQELQQSFSDTNCDVVMAACKVVEKNKIAECSALVRSVLARAKDEWLMNASSDALIALGERYAAVEMLVHHLDDSDSVVAQKALSTLAGQIVKTSSIGIGPKTGSGAKLKHQWLSFLERHKSDITNGVHFSPSQVAKLFPGFTFSETADSD